MIELKYEYKHYELINCNFPTLLTAPQAEIKD